MPKKAKAASIWFALGEVCDTCRVDWPVVVHWQYYRDKLSCKQRSKVLRKLSSDGWSPLEIALVCPMTVHGVRKAFRRRKAPRLSSRTARRAASSRDSIELISPTQYSLYQHTTRPRVRTGFTYEKTRHGIICKRVTLSKHPAYRLWRAMFARCYDQSAEQYRYYGARGIRVCSRWFDFRKFLRDVGERPPAAIFTRMDRRRHYTPLNCRWAARKAGG